jgi:tight adherence protein C
VSPSIGLTIAAAALVGLAVWAAVISLARSRGALDAHLATVERYGFQDPERQTQAPAARLERRRPLLAPLAERLGRRLLALAPALAPVAKGDLSAAGMYEHSPEAVQGYRLLASLLAVALALGYAQLLGGGIDPLAVVVALAAAVFGWWAPAYAIRRRGAARLAEIDRELPELIDLLVATVEAGLGLGASLELVAGRFRGALGEELAYTLYQQSLGMSNEEALGELVERVDTPAIRAFARTATRAETLGVSIGPIMRSLALDMRRRRRQTAREEVQKTPVKMLFPLMFLIFPSLFVVILYPALYTIVHQLSVGG